MLMKNKNQSHAYLPSTRPCWRHFLIGMVTKEIPQLLLVSLRSLEQPLQPETLIVNLLPGRSPAMNWAWPTILFTQTISTVLFGRMSDLIGRRYIFLFGNLVAFVGFLAGGRVKEPATATGLSALIGIGTSVQILAPFLNLAELVPIRHRFVVSGACMSCFAPLLAMSPAIGELRPGPRLCIL